MLSLRDKMIAMIWYMAVISANLKYPLKIIFYPVVIFHYIICIHTGNDLSVNIYLKGVPKLYHATCLIIGSNVQIGKNVIIRSRLILGEKSTNSGSGPIIGDNVEFGIDCTILGSVCIKDNSFVKSKSFIHD